MYARKYTVMQRTEIASLCSYAEQMMNDASKDIEKEKDLLEMAEKHLLSLLKDYKVECIDPQTGYIFSRLGLVKIAQKDYDMAEKYFLEALANLIVRGEFCQDRGLTYRSLGKTYFLKNNKEEAINHYIKAIHVYDSLAMYDKLKEMETELRNLGMKIENYLPAKEIGPNGIPTKCRECGGKDFRLIEETADRKIYECKNCNCRNVVLLEMIAMMQT